MIYFDNAATGGFKPQCVIEAFTNAVKYLSANPGRSGHRLSLTGAELVYSTREAVADFFNAEPERVIFTKNCTEGLNCALFGTLHGGDHVITTVFEHNSVLRPLYAMQKAGIITLDVVAPDNCCDVYSSIEKKINPKTALVSLTSASNVTGEVMPVKSVASLCKKNKIKLIIDGAQGGGHIPLKLEEGVSAIALASHKGLYGIMGSGVLVFNTDTEITPLTYGGTGTDSFLRTQPRFYPERLEAGTLNLPAICALNEGIRYLKKNFTDYAKITYSYTQTLIENLSKIQGVKLYSAPNPVGIVSFAVEGLDSTQVATELDKNYDIAVRGGFHCAPRCHEFLKTKDTGLTRVSLSAHNTLSEIDYFIKAVKKIAKG